MEAYLAAKLRLFTELLPPDGAAVVNADAEHAAQVIAAARERGRAVLTVGRGGDGAEARCARAATASPSACASRHGGKSYDIRLPLLGDYQASTRCSRPVSPSPPASRADARPAALAELEGVKGRLEIVGGCAAA